MSSDYAEKERTFLDSLKAKTGRDLAEWMAAIEARNLPHRNGIIDWLHEQGFTFAKASWLERIHANGGRPIYGPFPQASGDPAAAAARSAGKARVSRRAAPEAPAPAAPVTPSLHAPRTLPRTLKTPPARGPAHAPAAPEPAAAPPQKRSPAPEIQGSAPGEPDPAALEALFAKAKAYRPLARFVFTEIGKAVPGTAVAVSDAGAVFGFPAAFAVLVPGPREVKLGLALGSRAFSGNLVKAKFPGGALRIPATITHMIVLTDARQVDGSLIEAVKAAFSTVCNS